MNKKLLYIFMSVGGFIGGYLPVLFGAGGFSVWAILFSGVGSIVGIFVAAKLS